MKPVRSSYWNINAKVILVATYTKPNQIENLGRFFYNLKNINSIVIGVKDDTVNIFSYIPFNQATGKWFELENSSSGLFPDQLKNLYQYTYGIIFYDEYPQIFTTFDGLDGFLYGFINDVASRQNARLKFYKISKNSKSGDNFIAAFNKKVADFALNVGVKIKSYASMKMINTYQSDGFCAMLPYPRQKNFFDNVLSPFDLYSWLLIIFSMLTFVMVWILLSRKLNVKQDSIILFIFSFIGFFVGQSTEFRNHHKIQKTLIQLMIFQTFILGNSYQSMIISFMIRPGSVPKIHTIDGMIEKDFKFTSDGLFVDIFKNSESPLIEKIIQTTNGIENINFKKLSAENLGIILPCSMIDAMVNNLCFDCIYDKSATKYYYKVPDVIISYYLEIPTAPGSVFYERLQEFSLMSFEGGLQQYLESLKDSRMRQISIPDETNENENLLLLIKIAGLFYQLAVGLIISCVVMLGEIIYFKCSKRCTSKVEPKNVTESEFVVEDIE